MTAPSVAAQLQASMPEGFLAGLAELQAQAAKLAQAVRPPITAELAASLAPTKALEGASAQLRGIALQLAAAGKAELAAEYRQAVAARTSQAGTMRHRYDRLSRRVLSSNGPRWTYLLALAGEPAAEAKVLARAEEGDALAADIREFRDALKKAEAEVTELAAFAARVLLAHAVAIWAYAARRPRRRPASSLLLRHVAEPAAPPVAAQRDGRPTVSVSPEADASAPTYLELHRLIT